MKKKDSYTFKVNANFLGIQGLSQHKSTPWSIATLIQRFKFIDVNPPYQRDHVWSVKFKQDYIMAILEGTATALFHLVEKSDELSHYYWCMDAKQRLSAIRGFVDNEFYVMLECDDGKFRKAFWKDIQERSPALTRKFEDAQVSVEIYKTMKMHTQKLIFEKINQHVPLSEDERLYGANILTQALLKTLLVNSFKHISGYTKRQIRDNIKKFALRQVHIILMLAFGKRLDEEFAIKGYEKKKRTASAQAIEKMLENKGLSFDQLSSEYTWDKTVIEELGLKTLAKQFDNACRWLKDIVTYNNAQKGPTNIESGLCIELLAFLIKLQQNKAINSAYVRTNVKNFFNFVLAWIAHKSASVGTDNDLKKRTQDRGMVELRFREMERLAVEHGIDVKPKSKALSADQKLQASLNTGFRDPVDGRALTEDNVEIDHLVAKSQTSDENVAVVVSRSTNQMKSDITQDELKKLNHYIENKGHRAVKHDI